MKITGQPQDQTIKLKKKDFVIKLCCKAESPSRHELSYSWYSLKAFEKPGSFNEEKRVKSTYPCLEIRVSSSTLMNAYVQEKRYCCKVSAAGCSIWSRLVEIKFEHGKLLSEKVTQSHHPYFEVDAIVLNHYTSINIPLTDCCLPSINDNFVYIIITAKSTNCTRFVKEQ